MFFSPLSFRSPEKLRDRHGREARWSNRTYFSHGAAPASSSRLINPTGGRACPIYGLKWKMERDGGGYSSRAVGRDNLAEEEWILTDRNKKSQRIAPKLESLDYSNNDVISDNPAAYFSRHENERMQRRQRNVEIGEVQLVSRLQLVCTRPSNSANAISIAIVFISLFLLLPFFSKYRFPFLAEAAAANIN